MSSVDLMLEEVAWIIHRGVQETLYDPDHTGGTGNIFLNALEDKPDEAVELSWERGSQGFPSTLREDRVSVRVRGGDIDDRLSGADLAEKVSKALHGWQRNFDGVQDGRVLLIVAEDPPYFIGYDEKKRPEYQSMITVVTETRDLN